MSQVTDLVAQHLSDHPELINMDVVKEWKRIYEATEERSVELPQLLFLFKLSLLPEGSVPPLKVWDVIRTLKSNIMRGVEVRKKGLEPGMKVQVGGEERTIVTIGRDYGIHVKGKSGSHHPMSVVPSS